MVHVKNIILLFWVTTFFLACKEDLPEDPCSQCGENGTECIDDQCLCEEDSYAIWFLEDEKECRPLNDSFYVRVGHEGDISNFEILNLLKLSYSTKEEPNSMIRFNFGFPSEFIIELFYDGRADYDLTDYSKTSMGLIFQNDDRENSELPFSGNVRTLDGLSGFSGPKNAEYPNDGTPGAYAYGLGYEWFVEVTADSAILEADVYSHRDSSFLDDEITIYFERYRE